MEKKIQRYTITIDNNYVDENGEVVSHMERKNEGFNPYELLGLCEYLQLDILRQMHGEIRPDIVKRKVITEE